MELPQPIDPSEHSEISLQWFVAKAPLPVFVMDSEGRCLMANGAAGDLLGYAPGELVQKHFFELLEGHPHSSDGWESMRSFAGGT